MQPTTFSNEHLQIKMERLPACMVKFDVQVDKQATDAARYKAFKNVSKEVVLPGFRKGKAPEEVIRKQYPSQIAQEFRSIILQNAFFDTMGLTHIRPFNKNDYKMKVISLEENDQGAHLVYQFEAFPPIPTVSPQEITIPKIEPHEVSPNDIEEVIKNIRMQSAVWEEVDHPVTLDDHATVDIDIIDEPPTSICKDVRFEIADKTLHEWLRNALIGMKKDEVKELAPSDNTTNKDNENEWSTRMHRIKVKKVEHAKIPTLDDSLAKKSGVENVDQLKSAIQNQMQARRHEDSKEHQRQHMKQALLEKYPFDLPQTLMEQVRNIAGQLTKSTNETDLKQRRQSIEEYLYRDAALSILINQIAHDHNIELSEEELRIGGIRLWMKHLMHSQGENNEQELRRIQEDAPQQLLREKVLDYLIDQAKLGDVCNQNHLTG